MAKNGPIIYFGGNKYIVFGILSKKPFISRNYIWGFEGIVLEQKVFFVRGYCGQLVNLFITCITGLSYANLKSDSWKNL